MNVPDGFVPLSRTSPAMALVGQLYIRDTGGERVLGMRAGERHCNARGAVHGGSLAILADVALGYATAFASDPPLPLVTANLSLDFAGGASAGDWLEVRVDLHKRGARLAFANGFISVADRRIVRASAVFLATTAEPSRGETK